MLNNPNALQLKISLARIEPQIWRRLVLPIGWNLYQLHLAIQAAFNWENSHLHEFQVGPLTFGDISPESEPGERDLDEKSVLLANLSTMPNSSFLYLYDFGDMWYHHIEIEEAITLKVKPKHGFCIAGERACPPEDVGSDSGYQQFLEAISDVEHEDHSDMLDWFGGKFDPDHFNLEEADKNVKNALRANVRRRPSQPVSI